MQQAFDIELGKTLVEEFQCESVPVSSNYCFFNEMRVKFVPTVTEVLNHIPNHKKSKLVRSLIAPQES